MAKTETRLTVMEWIGLLGVLASTGVCVTAYAFTNFEQKADAREREIRLVVRIDELRDNQKIFMEKMGVNYKKSVKP